MIVALLPWALSREERSKDWRIPLDDQREVQYVTADKLLLSSSHTRCAVGLLKYPEWLHEYMKVGDRRYAIWIGETEGPNAIVDLEVGLLLSIMDGYPAARQLPADSREPIKAIFIHAQALSSVLKIPSLRERREIYDLMFVVFGTPASDVPPAQYPSGFREIYPIGMPISVFCANLTERLN